jgi:tripeptidyl-peptidase-1
MIDLKTRYHVPAHIQEHVDYITPGVKLFSEKRRPNRNSDLEKRSYKLPVLLESLGTTLEALLAIPELVACDIAITPACIKALYSVPAPTKSATGNQLGIFEDLGDVYSQTDLNLFFASFAR